LYRSRRAFSKDFNSAHVVSRQGGPDLVLGRCRDVSRDGAVTLSLLSRRLFAGLCCPGPRRLLSLRICR